jgi:putative PIN family toxin of toxin-antitoxin system
VRIVLDTNIIISGLLSETGPPGMLLKLWLEGKYELLISKAQLNELSRVFEYKKIRERIPSDQAADFLGQLSSLAIVTDPLLNINLSPDPDDNAILAVAIESQADFIVSGDKTDLLSLNKAEGIPIITARQAIQRFGKK